MSGAWHVLVVRDLPEDDDDRVTWMHPEDCPIEATLLNGEPARVEYRCAVAESLSNMGYYGLFDRRDDGLEVGVWLVRPYVEKIVGPTWTEWDGGWHVEPIEASPLMGVGS